MNIERARRCPRQFEIRWTGDGAETESFMDFGAGFVVERVENYPHRSLAFLAPNSLQGDFRCCSTHCLGGHLRSLCVGCQIQTAFLHELLHPGVKNRLSFFV
jgi:hypothetical protein